MFLEILQNSQENNCARVSFLIKLQTSEKKRHSCTGVLSEYCEISNNNFFYRTPPVAASVWANIESGNYLWNVALWLRYNSYEEDNLYSVVSTMLDQHCIEILFSQCCTRNVGSKCTDMSGSLFLTGYFITEQSLVFLFNVGLGVYLQIVGQ